MLGFQGPDGGCSCTPSRAHYPGDRDAPVPQAFARPPNAHARRCPDFSRPLAHPRPSHRRRCHRLRRDRQIPGPDRDRRPVLGWNVFQRRGSQSRYAVATKDEFGLEFSFHIGSFGEDRPWEVAKAAKEKAETLAKSKTRQDSDAVLKPAQWKASAVTIKKHLTVAGRDTIVTAVDSEFVAGPNKPPALPKLVELDFAIGYGQLNGVKKDQPYELRGYVRELPSVSLYVTRWVDQWLVVYTGARTGVITLQDGQVFVPEGANVKIFNVSATSFEVGLAFGLVVPIGQSDDAPSLTFELSPMCRNFNSLVPVPNTGTPKDLPHQMDLSGANFTIGLMFDIPKKK